MKKAVIIVAGGSGTRMGGEIPKQFIEIGRKPILMQTIERFYEYDKKIDTVVVLPSEQIDYWNKLCQEKNFNLPHRITEGGKTRFQSVKNGLKLIENTIDLIAVHDGVRPFVSIKVIERCFESAKELKAVIPVVDVVDSIREITSSGNKASTRDLYKLVQTPQVFDAQMFKKAYNQQYNNEFTDDASVVESIGVPVHLIDGNRENIKITASFDLKLAECLIKSQDPRIKT